VRTLFDVGLEVRARSNNFVVTTFESRDAFVGATPEGGGIILLNATLVGSVAGQRLTAKMNITAAPLVNRPPIARASSRQVLDAPLRDTTCAATVVLDATATSDPDGNLSSLRWFDRDGIFVGEGPTIEVPVQQSGALLFRLVAGDDIGGEATAETTVEVIRLPGECRLASDNFIQAANSPAESFTPCASPGPCPVAKTVTFTLQEPAEVFLRYDLGQSHGCCADHMVGLLRILLNGTEVLSDRIPFFNYGIPPFALEDFDYFFPPDVVMGLTPPVSQFDPSVVGPPLQNYKRVDRFALGNLAAGSYTVELQLGDAGWNSILEIYTLR
jgi:hypothetical protein